MYKDMHVIKKQKQFPAKNQKKKNNIHIYHEKKANERDGRVMQQISEF